jgi:hypothetical protein
MDKVQKEDISVRCTPSTEPSRSEEFYWLNLLAIEYKYLLISPATKFTSVTYKGLYLPHNKQSAPPHHK